MSSRALSLGPAMSAAAAPRAAPSRATQASRPSPAELNHFPQAIARGIARG
jgi:hypothetical protein